VAWLCVVTPYFILSSGKKILFIPTSLCIAVFVVSFGPWGMFAVSEKSQVSRLGELLANHHILVDGHVQSKHDSLQIETTREVSSIVGYLSEMHGLDAIQPWFGESLKRDTVDGGNAYKDPAFVAQLMGMTYVRTPLGSAGGTITMTTNRDKALDIDGYEGLLRGQRVLSAVTNREFPDHGIAYRTGPDLGTMTVTVWRDATPADSMRIDLKPLVDKLLEEYGKASTDKISPEKMAIVAASPTSKIKFFLSTVRIQRHEGTSEIISFEAEIAYKHGIN
jgi:hypothetical protein